MGVVKRAWNQNLALTIKSVKLQIRQWKTNIAQIALPILCLLFIFIMDIIITKIISKRKESFKPYAVDPSNMTNIVGLMYNIKNLYSYQNSVFYNASLTPFELEYEPPEFIYVSRTSNVSEYELGYLNSDDTADGFLGSMFNTSNLLTTGVAKTWSDNSVIRVPYFKFLPDEKSINSILYDFVNNGTQQLAYGALKFRTLNLNSSAPKIEYAVLAEERMATSFCKTATVLYGRIECHVYSHSLLSARVHDNALRVLTNGKYGIVGSVAQIPYVAKPPIIPRLGNYLGIFFFPVVLSLMLPVFTYTVVLEKETKIREMMKLMGMKMGYYWVNTYVFQYLMYAAGAILFAVFSAIFGFSIIIRTSPVIWILMLIGWGFMLVSFSILLSAVLRRTLLAVVVGYIIVLLGPLAAAILITSEVVKRNSWPWTPILLVYPFPLVEVLNAATAKCAVDTKCYTPTRDIVQDKDILMSIIFMFIDAALYAILGLYLDKILPSDWGVPAKPWFFLEWIWNNRFFKRQKLIHHHESTISEDVDEEVIKMEKEIDEGVYTPENTGVYIRNLRKEYDDSVFALLKNTFWKLFFKIKYKGEKKYKVKAAVKKLSLAIGKNECFGLLGANGAGKSTTMNILSGIIYKSSGEAAINGYNIDTDISTIRKRFGLCPQFDVLYDDLTVQDHLEFFARIKGVNDVKAHVKYLMDKVQLTKKARTLSKGLSGGMKRRLSIAISLVGDPSCVVLDEPTTGLDPLTKRTLWDLILEAKKNRCFILTTHSLEEADVLCDRIGIMTRGKMNSLGTSISLKHRYGKGFRISINYLPENKEVATSYIKQILPSAELHTEFVGNSTYEVNREGVKVSEVFKRMETEKRQYGINEWSINLCSLEDVFLTVARKDDEKFNAEYQQNKDLKPKCIVM